MSSTEQPIHAPLSHKHHLQIGEEKRIRLSGGPFIDTHTLADLTVWHCQGISYGVLIDRLTQHAKATGFDPVTNTTPKKKPAPRR
jgi:hypothetical protein